MKPRKPRPALEFTIESFGTPDAEQVLEMLYRGARAAARAKYLKRIERALNPTRLPEVES